MAMAMTNGRGGRRYSAAVAGAVAAVGAGGVRAATLTWDPGHTGTGPSDGNGPWDLTTAIWSTGSGDTTWTPGSDAVFGSAGTAGA